jgi:phage terminase large subunit-like protein
MDERQLQLYRLQQEALRRAKNDPLLNFRPHKKQKMFMDACLAGVCYLVLFFAANRAGKSEGGAAVGANLARFGPAKPNSIYNGAGRESIEVRDRATSGWVVSLDFNNSQEVIQPKYFDNGFLAGNGKPFIPEREIKKWRIKDQVLKLKNGSLIGFKSCDSEVKKFQGAGKDWIHFDEEPPKEIFDEATIRVGGGRRLLVFLTCTLLPPPGQAGGVTWSFDEFVKPWQRGQLKEAEIFTASIYDNPYIMPEEIARLEARYGKDSLMGRIRLGGELLPGVSGSRAYPNFDRNIHVQELGSPEPGRPLAWCWDFNVAPMITEIGQLWGNTFKFYDELIIEDNANIPDMVEKFYERYHDWRGPIWLYGDQTGSNRGSQTGIGDWTAIMNCLRPHNFTVAKKIPDKNPFVSMRLNSVQTNLKDEHGVSHIIVDPKCQELIEDFEGVLLEKGGGIKKSRKPEEPYYRRTHASDSATYWITYERPIRESTIDERDPVKIKNTSYGFQKR